jgi:hypothetical protein
MAYAPSSMALWPGWHISLLQRKWGEGALGAFPPDLQRLPVCLERVMLNALRWA